jgi:hypothetical protein
MIDKVIYLQDASWKASAIAQNAVFQFFHGVDYLMQSTNIIILNGSHYTLKAANKSWSNYPLIALTDKINDRETFMQGIGILLLSGPQKCL